MDVRRGALLHSPAWIQMMADALGRPVTICTENEASCAAAVGAGTARGIIDGFDLSPVRYSHPVRNITTLTGIFSPTKPTL